MDLGDASVGAGMVVDARPSPSHDPIDSAIGGDSPSMRDDGNEVIAAEVSYARVHDAINVNVMGDQDVAVNPTIDAFVPAKKVNKNKEEGFGDETRLVCGLKRGSFFVLAFLVVVVIIVVVVSLITVGRDGATNENADNVKSSNFPPSPSPTSAPTSEDVLAFVPEHICMERFPGQGRSVLCLPNETIDNGGGACGIVAKSVLDLEDSPGFSADISIQNAGACRTDFQAGKFTKSLANHMLPFSNLIVLVTLSGDQIRWTLETALEYALRDVRTGSYPYAYGLRFKLDASKPFGSRFYDVEVNSRMNSIFGWTPIDLEKEYVVVTNSYIGARANDYFLNVTNDNAFDVTDVDYTTEFIRWARLQETILDLPLEQYSTQFYVPPSVPPHTPHPQ